MATSVLLMNNEPRDGDTLRRHFAKEHFEVMEASLRSGAQTQLAESDPDLIVVNLNTSGMSAAELAEAIRKWSHVPLIVVSTPAMSGYQVTALDAGADDFITRPYHADELLARVRAVLRRSRQAEKAETSKAIEIGGLRIDLKARRAFVNNRDMRLTRTEFALLAELASKVDQICTHNELLAKVWGWEYWGAHHYLHVYLGRIRRKLGDDLSGLLQTVPGMGYVLSATPQDARAAVGAM